MRRYLAKLFLFFSLPETFLSLISDPAARLDGRPSDFFQCSYALTPLFTFCRFCASPAPSTQIFSSGPPPFHLAFLSRFGFVAFSTAFGVFLPPCPSTTNFLFSWCSHMLSDPNPPAAGPLQLRFLTPSLPFGSFIPSALQILDGFHGRQPLSKPYYFFFWFGLYTSTWPFPFQAPLCSHLEPDTISCFIRSCMFFVLILPRGPPFSSPHFSFFSTSTSRFLCTTF